MTDLSELLTLMKAVRAELKRYGETVPPYDFNKYDAWRTARDTALRELKAELEKRGAVFRETTGGYAIRLAGLRATSTSGIVGAAGNWLVQARKATDGNRLSGAA